MPVTARKLLLMRISRVLLESLGHGSSTYNGPWTAHCVLECLEDLLDGLFGGDLGMTPTKLLLHGHSLGAYVALRLLHGRHGDRVEALLLESPMTCYSPIFDEIFRTFVGHVGCQVFALD